MRGLALVLLLTYLPAEDMPGWVLPGIAMRETHSYFRQNDLIYVDRRIGALGERGPFQMQRVAFDQVAIRGERFEDLAKDMTFAQDKACSYLWWLYQGPGRRSWLRAVSLYNAGTDPRLPTFTTYLQDVRHYGRGHVAAGWGG